MQRSFNYVLQMHVSSCWLLPVDMSGQCSGSFMCPVVRMFAWIYSLMKRETDC